VGSGRGRSDGAELEGENKRGGRVEGWRGGGVEGVEGVEGWRGGGGGGGVRGYFTPLEGLVGVGSSAVMLLYRTLHLLGLSLANICVCTRRYGGMHT
jgi:hypothetical protein